MTVQFYLRMAAQALWRDRQRSLLALVCIAFGVLSLVAMQLLASMISDAFLVQPRLAAQGDATLSLTGQPVGTEQLADLDRSLQAGIISGYSVTVSTQQILLRTQRSGRVYFLTRALAVNPDVYPLLGTVDLMTSEPFADALTPLGGAIITRDLAERLTLSLGDEIALSSGRGGAPLRLTISGIARQTPDRLGGTVFFSMETAQANGLLRNRRVSVTWADSAAAHPKLEAAGWTVDPTPAEPDTEAAALFTFMLAGAGILGLLIGGIGVANTMQVILARRTREVAVLKTIGYRQADLLRLFGLETALLGLIGGAVGTLIAVLLSGQFLALLKSNVPFLLEYEIDLLIVFGGLLIGVLTAVIFGLAAIVKASGIRPGVLLRETPIRPSRRTQLAMVGLYGLLLVLFIALSSFVLGSVLWGLGTVAVGLAGLLLLGGVMTLVLLGIVRLPTPGMPFFRMAVRNIRYHPTRAAFGLVALFVGVLAIGFATSTLWNAQARMSARLLDTSGHNLQIQATLADDDAIRAALDHPDITAAHAAYPVPVVARTTSDSLLRLFPTASGRYAADSTWDLTFAEGRWREAEDAVHVPDNFFGQPTHLALGDTLHLAGPADTLAFVVAGTYERIPNAQRFMPTFDLLISREAALKLGGSTVGVKYDVAVEPARLSPVATTLGQALPTTTVLTLDDLGDFLNRLFRGLYLFAIAVAALALVAGAVLIANAVGLSMVERQRELGVLKAVGFTSNSVLRTVLLENALLGFLGGLAGVAGVYVLIALINTQAPSAGLGLLWWQAFGLIGFSMLLTVGSAALVAWRPTHVRPLTVLRSE